jgi:hypothetical protein
MGLFYSPAKGGFYDDEVHSVLPADARPISRELHSELMRQQGEGRVIVPGGINGDPVAVELVPDPEQHLASIRAVRDKLLRASDHTQLHDLPISDELRAEWATYRQALRDLPALINNVDPVEWPTPPQQ